MYICMYAIFLTKRDDQLRILNERGEKVACKHANMVNTYMYEVRYILLCRINYEQSHSQRRTKPRKSFTDYM